MCSKLSPVNEVAFALDTVQRHSHLHSFLLQSQCQTDQSRCMSAVFLRVVSLSFFPRHLVIITQPQGATPFSLSKIKQHICLTTIIVWCVAHIWGLLYFFSHCNGLPGIFLWKRGTAGHCWKTQKQSPASVIMEVTMFTLQPLEKLTPEVRSWLRSLGSNATTTR